MPMSNVDHTISGKGTAISTLDHSATTPRVGFMLSRGGGGCIKCQAHYQSNEIFIYNFFFYVCIRCYCISMLCNIHHCCQALVYCVVLCNVRNSALQ